MFKKDTLLKPPMIITFYYIDIAYYIVVIVVVVAIVVTIPNLMLLSKTLRLSRFRSTRRISGQIVSLKHNDYKVDDMI